jgi:hypothetical protein
MAGYVATVNVNKTATAKDIQYAMFHQCRLPGWRYVIIDNEKILHDMDSIMEQATEDKDIPDVMRNVTLKN